ncbi:hypothetical protein PanWU01x14_056430, partial [Parasponia andersonii]
GSNWSKRESKSTFLAEGGTVEQMQLCGSTASRIRVARSRRHHVVDVKLVETGWHGLATPLNSHAALSGVGYGLASNCASMRC